MKTATKLFIVYLDFIGRKAHVFTKTHVIVWVSKCHNILGQKVQNIRIWPIIFLYAYHKLIVGECSKSLLQLVIRKIIVSNRKNSSYDIICVSACLPELSWKGMCCLRLVSMRRMYTEGHIDHDICAYRKKSYLLLMMWCNYVYRYLYIRRLAIALFRSYGFDSVRCRKQMQ